MRILCTDTVTLPLLATAHPRHLGFLLTPRSGHDVGWVARTFPAWACDNCAYTGFDQNAYLRMLDRIAGVSPGPLWVTLPDVVGDARATLDLASLWLPELQSRGLPAALVAQDGLTWPQIPFAAVAAFFVGGSTAWKLGPAVPPLVRAARDWRLWVHVGRCSTLRRMERFHRLGCDSIDGTIFARQPRKWLSIGLRWLTRMERQPALW